MSDALDVRLRWSVSAPFASLKDAPLKWWNWQTRRRFPGVSSEQRVAARRRSGALAFDVASEPLVSVVIPAHGKYPLTWACLEALAAARTKCMFEVIVVDDASPDATAEVMASVAGVRLLRNERNLGFIASCNAGARIAKAPWLCFLNNDTHVTDGWLDELLWTANSDAEIGIVGSQLVFPDGRMQEAGATIFKDGTGHHLGRNRDRKRPEYNFARDVDYVSGASLLISKQLFEQLGGFDPYFAPAYFEDVDLAFKVRRAGKRVRYQPLSVVVHYEGMTSGRSEARGVKRYQLENREKFVARWQRELSAEHAPAQWRTVASATLRQPRKLLVVTEQLPTPGSEPHARLLRLSRGPNHVSLFATNCTESCERSRSLRRAGVEVFYRPYVSSLGQAVAEAARRGALTLWAWQPKLAKAAAIACRACAPSARIYGHGSSREPEWHEIEAFIHGLESDESMLVGGVSAHRTACASLDAIA